MTQCFLVRHADAGSRGIQNDAERALSRRGRTQADALVAQFAGDGITVIRSSPYARCMETVAPLAAASASVAEPDASLGEGTGAAPTLALIEAATVPTILCSHGDVIGVNSAGMPAVWVGSAVSLIRSSPRFGDCGRADTGQRIHYALKAAHMGSSGRWARPTPSAHAC